MNPLIRARESMTAEQRWTGGVCVLLTLALLLFGHPGVPVILHRAGSPPDAGAGGGGAPVATGPVAEDGVDLDVLSPPPVTQSPAPSSSPSGGSAPARDALPPDSVAPVAADLRVVALVAPGGVSGRDDATAAEVFLGVEAFPAGPAWCEQVAGAADIAVAGLDLDDGLRRCLADRGVTVLAFDDGGPGERIVSTRRGAVLALGDAVRWGLSSGALEGRVGLVASASLRGPLEPATRAWRDAGLDVVATAFVDDDAAGPATADVRRFVAEDVEVVLFALPAHPAGRWALQHAVLDPAVRYVVGDAFDSLWSEDYPPVLDGAMALTSLRVPWWAREKGETDLQARCREKWEAAVVPPVLLPGDETVRVYAWCQHAALVEGVAATAELTALRRASPLTSDLGPLVDGGWGPQQDAVLSWDAPCRCWQSVEPFTLRRTHDSAA